MEPETLIHPMEHLFQPKNEYYVYYLIDSTNNQPFYVGKGHRTRKAMYSSGFVDRVSKEIRLLSPDGTIIITKNISQFCRDNGLQSGNLYKVLNGKIKKHRGWKLPPKVV